MKGLQSQGPHRLLDDRWLPRQEQFQRSDETELGSTAPPCLDSGTTSTAFQIGFVTFLPTVCLFIYFVSFLSLNGAQQNCPANGYVTWQQTS